VAWQAYCDRFDAAFVCRAVATTASLSPTFPDDREARFNCGPGRRELLKMICPSAKVKYFWRGLDIRAPQSASDLPVSQQPGP
jgi:hypothetical protein